MSGLPPTGLNNKVATRSKTVSIKRPISMDISEHKKESKGLFSKLKKGSSNSRLDEESQYRESSPKIANFNQNNNSKLTQNNVPVARIQGRNFDSDDDDYEIYPNETRVTKMEKMFNNNEKVMKNPALVGALLKYLFLHNIDYYCVLYYLIVQHYKIVMQNKELAKEATRFINEIYTTFLHEKSVLRIEFYHVQPVIIEDLKNIKDLSTFFDESANYVFNFSITNCIQKIKTSIAHGLFNLEINIDGLSFDERISYFNGVIKYFIKGFEEKFPHENNQNATKETKEQEQFQADLISGVKSALATLYFYFSKKERDDNSDNVSVVSAKFNSLLGKSIESIPFMTNCILDKQPMFCFKMHKKTSNHSFFKKGKVLKGHNFQEKIFDYPALCLLCEKLIWGIAPQGFLCSNCLGASHKGCKDFVRITCQKDYKRSNRNSYNLNVQLEDDSKKNSIVEESFANGTITSDGAESKEVHNVDGADNESKNISIENETIPEDTMQLSVTSVSSEISHTIKPNIITSTATIIVTNNDEKSSENTFDTESMDSVSEFPYLDKQTEIVKSEGEKFEIHRDEKSHVRTMASKYDQKSIPRSQSDNTEHSSTIPRSKQVSDSVQIQELIQEQSAWNNDPDMKVGETFEADKELKSFPDHLSKEVDKAEYMRLLVLMEFHHKTKFTVMTLKRFDYLLIKSWPADETLLFSTLSLNCIQPLYGLIKMLAITIESCRTESTYNSDTAVKVLDWLVSNDESNLQEWLKYSIDLCCTNSLLLVKNSWKDARKTDARLNILDKRYNKILMVEQLSNMRPLLFNFPLIVNNLIRDLSKFSKFKEEVKIWKVIHEKFKLLPTFIDEHCMPLVQLINNGTIINSVDRNSWMQRITSIDPYYNFVLDFPKTAFHFKLFDFQEIKISKFSESGRKVPAVFVKETIDAIAICYENMLVLLQKENDKYLLKQFKSSESTKCTPILTVDNVHTSKGEKKGSSYELTIVFIDVAVLTQLLFSKKDVMDKWYDFIYKIKSKMMKNNEKSLNNNTRKKKNPGIDKEDSGHNFHTSTSQDIESSEILNNQMQVVSKFDTMKESIDEYLLCLNSMKLESDSLTTLYPTPNDSYEFFIGTIHDAGNILKLCHENYNTTALTRSSLSSICDEVLDQLLINISVMRNRVEHFKNSREKDTISITDIDYVISERNEPSIQSLEDSQPESVNLNELEDQDEILFHNMDNPVPSPEDVENSKFHPDDDDDDNDDDQPQFELLTSFVNDYVDKIIAAAQLEINQSIESTDNNSEEILNSHENLCVDQISQSSN